MPAPYYPPRPAVSTARAGRAVKRLGCINPGSAIGIGGFICLVGSLFVPRLFLSLVVLAGIVLIVMGLIIERMFVRWLCDQCGNRVEKHSTLCPSCRCLLEPRKSTAIYWIFAMLLIIAGAFVWLGLLAKP